MYIKRELLNPTGFKFEPTQCDFFETVRTVYNLAYRLLCDTIGEENIVKKGERRNWILKRCVGLDHWASTCYNSIPIEEVAEKMGIEIVYDGCWGEKPKIYKTNMREHALELISQGELNKPLRDFGFPENIFVNSEIFAIRSMNTLYAEQKAHEYMCHIRTELRDEQTRYNIARAIAKIYFSTELFEELFAYQYVFSSHIIDGHRDIVEEIFAAALLLPDKLMEATSIEFQPLDCTIEDHLHLVADVSSAKALEMFNWWKFYRHSLALENKNHQ